jgi:hypothetical protein
MLEDTLATGGFPDEAPEELESMSFRALLRFFEKCMRDSSPKKRRFGANPQTLTNVPRRPSSGGGSGTGGFNGGFAFGSAFGGAGYNAAGGAAGDAPTGIDIGAVPTVGPDQLRRNQAEAMGRRTRPQGYMQGHLADMKVPAKLYKSHSLRKGGATAILAAKVSLPQIQLMARWVSPNMAQLYAALAADVSGEVLTAIGRVETLDLQHHEKQFWAAYTTNASSGFAGHSR